MGDVLKEPLWALRFTPMAGLNPDHSNSAPVGTLAGLRLSKGIRRESSVVCPFSPVKHKSKAPPIAVEIFMILMELRFLGKSYTEVLPHFSWCFFR
jgi:hypothetical protein